MDRHKILYCATFCHIRFSSDTPIIHKVDGGTDYLSEAKSVTDEAIEDKIDWVAFKNQFFSAVMIAKNDFAENTSLSSSCIFL